MNDANQPIEEVDQIIDSACRYVINRPTHTEDEFQKQISGKEVPPEACTVGDKVKKCVQKCTFKNLVNSFVGLFPILNWLRHYQVRQWLPGDIVAGLTVGVVHIPQSMAFSLLAGLPPVYGLYTSFYPVFIYTLMGTSRHISVGTFAVTSLLTQAVVVRLVPDQIPTNANLANITTVASDVNMDLGANIEARKVAVASSLMFIMGLFQLVFGIFRLGFITTYLSESVIQAFTTGAAIHVVTSQAPSILGIRVQGFSGIGAFFRNWIEIFRNLPDIHVGTLVISIVCIVLLVFGREINLRYKQKLKIPLPTEVIVVAIATISSHFGMFQQNFGVVIIDNIPTGFPSPVLPNFSIIGDIIIDGFAIAVVGFAISVSLSKMYAEKYGYVIDANQELLAYGVSNIFPSFFSCFPNAAALARCVIQENTGGKTQMVGIISVVIVLITILVLGPIFEPLPRAVLGCIIIVGLFGILQQLSQLKPIYKMSKVDFIVWIVTLAAVVVLGVDLGLLAGVVFSIFTVIIRTQMPKCEVLGRVGDTDIYRCCQGYTTAIPFDGIVIFKFHSPLYYANKDFFKKKLFCATGINPDMEIARRNKTEKPIEKQNDKKGRNWCFFRKKNKSESYDLTIAQRNPSASQETSDSCSETTITVKPKFHTLIIDCAAFTFIDLVGMKALKAVCKSYREIGINLLLANVCGNVRKALQAVSYYDVAGDDGEFISVHDAAIHSHHSKNEVSS